MLGITGASSSLGINASQDDQRGGVKLPKKFSTLSLPNLVSPRLRRNNCVIDDEIDSSDQPIDFSKKYCETTKVVVKSYNSSFTMYAETDLDQPTDYSLRYAEDDSDSDECTKAKTEFVQDTVKTYCTEDTPYETPFNFSTSTSMSDLRIDSKMGAEPKRSVLVAIKQVPEKSEFSSGLMSPEKPVNYCDEGTPGYFSRVDSCGSLNEPPKEQSKDNVPDVKDKETRRSEVKAVKFEEVVNYAEETPLMFSRSSSLASLDSIEQHSIHDDRSSVISDLSRLTSGLISPSELPDSPSQTIPPSPKPRKNPIVFPEKKTEQHATAQTVPKLSVFEDVVKKFKMETTPLHFSSATSLSSLIMDEIDAKSHDQEQPGDIKTDELSESSEDEDILAACINIGMQNNRYNRSPPPKIIPIEVAGDSLRTYCTEDTPAILSHAGSRSDLSVLSLSKAAQDPPLQEEEECDKTPEKIENDPSDEEDDDILANCINIGMKNNKYSQSRPHLGDSVRSYYTEDTPAVLSHAGSCSDIFAERADLSDINSSFSSDDDERLLAECVRTGMAKISGRKDDECAENLPREFSLEGNTSDSSSDESLLQECILAGMPKRAPKPEDSADLTDAEKALLQEIIVEGMKKCRITAPKEDSSDLTEAEQALLRQCILSGMPKNKNLTQGGPSAARESAELTASERLLLQQCILAGMPKAKGKWTKRPKEAEHTCCVHCPRNYQNRQDYVKAKRKNKERHGRDILYVTSQILALKKEIVDRSHEEWV